MRMSFLEWAARAAMLALAGMVTLSILGSIAAISSDEGPTGTIARRADIPAPAPPPEAVPQPVSDERRQASAAAPGEKIETGAGGIGAAAAPSPELEEERWLEAIAYALLALAGLFAIAVLLLWNALRRLGRIADAVEARGRH